jgi:hypothetical protein
MSQARGISRAAEPAVEVCEGALPCVGGATHETLGPVTTMQDAKTRPSTWPARPALTRAAALAGILLSVPALAAEKTILTIAKKLYDGLNGIDRDHPDVPDDLPEQATDELIRAKTGLLFEQRTVDQILALLDGTTAYTTNAPVGLTISIPDSLAKKLRAGSRT